MELVLWTYLSLAKTVLDKKKGGTRFSEAFLELCVKPEAGSVVTGAFFHLPPFVNVDKETGDKVGLNICVQYIILA